MKQNYDVVAIGGGHAGCEAALASARMGRETLLVTLRADKIAEMSCNPSIGGVGKGQLVKEIDALGGEMGRNADYTGIQFKRLNTRKGSAVQSSRCQSDKRLYAERMRSVVAEQPRLTVLEGEVKALIVIDGRIEGVEVVAGGKGHRLSSQNVVITAGTFMRSLMHCGDVRTAGGRFGEGSSEGLSDRLRELGLSLLRLKTGTPPRLLRDSIQFAAMEAQPGDAVARRFSFFKSEIVLPQVPCYLTYTNPETHTEIRGSLDRSPLYSGKIRGIGPRYCPSIEDKVVKFPEKVRHQLFFEPESLDSDWIYPNGISTSLPADVQERFVRTIPGCADVQFARYGYAVEYDCIDPRQLLPSLECRFVRGLFFGGQVNGTSGYEEAAAQGLIAGINAALRAAGSAPLILSRNEAYIGVMIDDLVTLGISEPYRMFTSRAEFRLSLREDNADLRLSHRSHEIGLLAPPDFARVQERRASIARWKDRLSNIWVKPAEEVQRKLSAVGSAPLPYAQTLGQLLKRPELSLEDVRDLAPEVDLQEPERLVVETLEVELKYAGYITRQQEEIDRLERMQELSLPPSMDYSVINGLSVEVRDKLTKARPDTLADAAKISGVTPVALTALLFHLRQKGGAPDSSRS